MHNTRLQKKSDPQKIQKNLNRLPPCPRILGEGTFLQNADIAHAQINNEQNTDNMKKGQDQRGRCCTERKRIDTKVDSARPPYMRLGIAKFVGDIE